MHNTDTDTARGQLTTLSATRQFIRGGRAIFTIVSMRTGRRFTYRVRGVHGRTNFFFVDLLTGPDNVIDFTFIGTLGQKYPETLTYKHSAKSSIGIETTGVTAFRFFIHLLNAADHPDEYQGLEVWHEGKCGRCGRRLTDPESIAAGLGPHCRTKGMAA